MRLGRELWAKFGSAAHVFSSSILCSSFSFPLAITNRRGTGEVVRSCGTSPRQKMFRGLTPVSRKVPACSWLCSMRSGGLDENELVIHVVCLAKYLNKMQLGKGVDKSKVRAPWTCIILYSNAHKGPLWMHNVHFSWGCRFEMGCVTFHLIYCKR